MKVYIGGGGASSDREEQTVMAYDPTQDSYDTLPPYVPKSGINAGLSIAGSSRGRSRHVPVF